MLRSHPRLAAAIFAVLVIGGAWLGGKPSLAVYGLSFWHYCLYWLAYLFGARSFGGFKRDAIVAKAVSLIALACVYLAAPLDLFSLAVVASGFLLNILAASALGSDHPMLTGNIVAFGGTLINAEFRQQWWPLAATHVAMNLGLLAMELAVPPQRRGARFYSRYAPRFPSRRGDSL
jgi:hypothetical protein